MVLSILIATVTAPGLLGTQEAIRQSQAKEKREEHRARRCNLIATCVKSSMRSREINGRPIVLKDGKLYIDTGTSDGGAFGHQYAGYYLPYPDEKYEGLVTTITDEAPIMNWIYVDKDTYEIKYGVRLNAQPNFTGPFDCTHQDRRLTFDGWEGFCAVEEFPTIWSLYFDKDDNGLCTKVPPGTRVLEIELSRKEKRWKKETETRQQDQTTQRTVDTNEDEPVEKPLAVEPQPQNPLAKEDPSQPLSESRMTPLKPLFDKPSPFFQKLKERATLVRPQHMEPRDNLSSPKSAEETSLSFEVEKVSPILKIATPTESQDTSIEPQPSKAPVQVQPIKEGNGWRSQNTTRKLDIPSFQPPLPEQIPNTSHTNTSTVSPPADPPAQETTKASSLLLEQESITPILSTDPAIFPGAPELSQIPYQRARENSTSKPQDRQTATNIHHPPKEAPQRPLPATPTSPIKRRPILPDKRQPNSSNKSHPISPTKSRPTSPTKTRPTSPTKSRPTSPTKTRPTSPIKSRPPSPKKTHPITPKRPLPTRPRAPSTSSQTNDTSKKFPFRPLTRAPTAPPVAPGRVSIATATMTTGEKTPMHSRISENGRLSADLKEGKRDSELFGEIDGNKVEANGEKVPETRTPRKRAPMRKEVSLKREGKVPVSPIQRMFDIARRVSGGKRGGEGGKL